MGPPLPPVDVDWLNARVEEVDPGGTRRRQPLAPPVQRDALVVPATTGSETPGSFGLPPRKGRLVRQPRLAKGGLAWRDTGPVGRGSDGPQVSRGPSFCPTVRSVGRLVLCAQV